MVSIFLFLYNTIQKARRQSMEDMSGLLAGRGLEPKKLPKKIPEIVSARPYSEASSSETKSRQPSNRDQNRERETPIFEKSKETKISDSIKPNKIKPSKNFLDEDSIRDLK